MLKETYLARVGKVPPGAIVEIVTRPHENHILSPSWELLNDWKARRISWEEFDRRFRIEMSSPAAVAEMKRLKKLAEKQDVYLVCYEGIPPVYCHRFILLEVISSMDA
jgi:uncharacterized protein YeaO (DUF488 family)